MSKELSSNLSEILSKIDTKTPELIQEYLEYRMFMNEICAYVAIGLIVIGIAVIVIGIYKEWKPEPIMVMGILPILIGCLLGFSAGVSLYKIKNHPDIFIIDNLVGK